MITMKFGGTSVGNADAMDQVAAIVEGYLGKGEKVAVVVSAMSGTTDMLIESVNMALAQDKWGYLSLSQDIRDKHEDAINQLIKPGSMRKAVLEEIDTLLQKHVELCGAINILGEATPRIRDAVVSFGERLSSRVLATVLRARGVKAQQFDGGTFLITNDNYQSADPFWDESEQRIKQQLIPLIEEGVTPIITGFLGATPDGSITTLGRGGSDYSAAIFAAYLESDELIIWTDVDGVMTTDPRIDDRAQVLPYVSYTEVGELAYYGAKVLHPKTVQPIISRGIAMSVRNTFNPDYPGTRVGAEMQATDGVIKAVTSIRSVSLLTVSGKGMLGVPGIAGRTFLASANAGASILMISQSSSEQSFCFTVVDDRAQHVKNAVETELQAEIQHRDVDGIAVTDGVVIVTVVGAGMRAKPGIAGRVFTTLGDHEVNVLAIAQGSSECSISFVIGEEDVAEAVRCLHDLALQTFAV